MSSGVNLTLIFRIDNELGKEILFVLIDAAETSYRGSPIHDAKNAQHFIAIRKRHRIDDRSSIDDEQSDRTLAISAPRLKASYFLGTAREKEKRHGATEPMVRAETDFLAKEIAKRR